MRDKGKLKELKKTVTAINSKWKIKMRNLLIEIMRKKNRKTQSLLRMDWTYTAKDIFGNEINMEIRMEFGGF